MSNPLAKMTTAMPLITTAENNNNEDLLVKAVPALAAPASDTSCTSSTTVSSLTTTTQPSVSSSAGPLHRSSSTEPEEEEDPVVPQVTYVSAIPPPLSNISLQEEDSVRVDAAAAEEACLCGRHGTEQVVRINEDSILSKSTRIGWGSIVIYLHPIVPGEHADCLYGPPLTIAWEAIEEESTSVEAYESERAPRRRVAEDLRLGVSHRRRVLRRLGFGERDLKAAQNEARRRRLDREWTRSNLNWEWWDIFMQSFRRKIGRAFRGKARPLTTKY